MGGLGFVMRHSRPGASRFLIALSVAGCVGSVGFQGYRAFVEARQSPPDRYHGVVGYVMAQRVLAELREGQAEVVLVFPPRPFGSDAETEALYDTFSRVFSPARSVEVQVARLPSTPRAKQSGIIPLEAAEAAIAPFPKANVYVFFAGVPEPFAKLSALARSPRPALYAFDPSNHRGWEEAVKRGDLSAVIAPRRGAPAPSRDLAGPPNEIFQRFFEVISTRSEKDRK